MPHDYSKIKPLDSAETIFNLKGRVGLIAGGGGKMGQQFALVLARAGAHVILADVNGDTAKKAAEEIATQSGGIVEGMDFDVTDEKKVNELFDKIGKSHGRLDFLISNMMGKPAGYYRPFDKYSKETWQKVLDINLTGSFLCCQKATPLLKAAGGGSIILTASTYGVVGPDQRIYADCSPASNLYDNADPLCAPGAYSASKGGLISFSRYLATLLGPDKIRVNVLTPGGVYDGQEESFHKAYAGRTPLGRMATWSDYNGAILFLASDASQYMTGANLIIDGGWTAW